MTFIRTFLSHREEDGCTNSIAMCMDNASVHDKQALVESCRVKNHTLVMGPEYTPEMNPIEMIFGVWKNDVER